MLGIHDYGLFVAAGILLNLTPGQDTFYILGRSLAQGVRAGVASAVGVNAGSLVHTAMAALGLSAILAASTKVFTIVKLLGGAYLIYIGVRMIVAPRPEPASRGAHARSTGSVSTAFRDGLLTNLLNPKVALFFLALMPQFIEPTSDARVLAFVVLGLTFVTTGTLWCLVLAICTGRLRGFFGRHPRRLDIISRAAGGLFVALGVRVAVHRS